ncbi:MAG: cadherin-like beta sandwich domain-containing protein, partial [Treponema sp.]|nr:cadherin-like beta sandwich domain-containing protein [Treponema sp.]
MIMSSCENTMIQELLRAPVSLESISVTSDVWTEGEAPYALSPAFEPGITAYEVTVPFETREVHFRGTPRQRASVRYAAADGSPELRTGVFSYTGNENKVFTVTAWEEYMDDAHYEITVKRNLPSDYLADLE